MTSIPAPIKFGAVFPQTEIGMDPGAIKEFAQGIEKMGFDHIVIYDHVVGANRESRPGWEGVYDLEALFHEPFMALSFMAGVTTTINFFTGVLILPQRQTVLVAKQAACVDVLSGGRLRLGVGSGWNAVEYEALNVPFQKRGEIFDDQIHVLRELWSKKAVTIKTPWHTITDAGLNPLPIQQPIPIWFGGGARFVPIIKPAAERVMRRIAKLGNGWMPPFAPDEDGAAMMETFRGYVRDYGRDPSEIGIESYLTFNRANADQWSVMVKDWVALGATYAAIETLRDGLKGCNAHLRRFEEIAKQLAIPAGPQ